METVSPLALFGWCAAAFFAGSLPFSVWIGRLALGKDIRTVGDKNPGATNVLRAGGYGWYALALALDISKAATPVGLAHQIFGIDGWPIVLIGIMPSLGHAFSPFLRFNGGKAVASAGGAWIGLNGLYLPLVVGLLVIWSLLIKPSGWALIGTMVTLLLIFALQGVWVPIGLAIVQLILFIYKHTDDLSQRPMWYFSKSA